MYVEAKTMGHFKFLKKRQIIFSNPGVSAEVPYNFKIKNNLISVSRMEPDMCTQKYSKV